MEKRGLSAEAALCCIHAVFKVDLCLAKQVSHMSNYLYLGAEGGGGGGRMVMYR